MGAARKLQVEIDRVLKKVQEGIVEFDQIWEKVSPYLPTRAHCRQVYETESQSQRENYEEARIAGSEIKDKTTLMEARKNIEREMERFKHCEKEAKTKAFSKAGLGQATKLDPEEKARQESREWLNEQIDGFEAELESINVSNKRGKKPTPRQQTLDEYIVRHRSHIARLEQCMRCLDNCTVAHQEIEDLKEMVEYYVENYDDESGSMDCVDETYATVLDRLNDVTLGVTTAHTTREKKAKDLEEEQAEREREKERAAAAAVKAQLLSHGSNAAALLEEDKKTRTPPVAANQTQIKRRVSMSEVPNHATEESEGVSPATKTAVLGAAVKNDVPNGGLSFASAAAGRNAAGQGQRSNSVWDNKGEDGEYPKLAGVASEKSKSLEIVADVKPSLKRPSLDTTLSIQSSKPIPYPPEPPSYSTAALTETKHPNHTLERGGFKAALIMGTASSNIKESESEAAIDPLLMLADVQDLMKQLTMSGDEASSSSVQPAIGQVVGNPAASLHLLQGCSRRSMPQPIDGDYKTQLSQNSSRSVVQQLPASFPIHRLLQLEDAKFYHQLDTEGLFYAFYFLPGDVAQYCAAKELKRQEWRYHMEQKAWFQRSGEPKVKTKEYEEGSYVYFDKNVSPLGVGLSPDPENFQNGWCYRTKDNFIFRYDQLEDELQ